MILVDAGTMVAWVDASDQHHAACAAALAELREPMGTVWPAVTEALYLLADLPRGQDAVLEILRRGVVRLLPLGEEDVPRILELVAKYRQRRMSLADAALVRVAERDGLDRVFTVDRRDFEAYRIGRRKTFRIVPQGRAGGGWRSEGSSAGGGGPMSRSAGRRALRRRLGHRNGPSAATAEGPSVSARRASSAHEGWSDAGRADLARRAYGTARPGSIGRAQSGQAAGASPEVVTVAAARRSNRWSVPVERSATPGAGASRACRTGTAGGPRARETP